MSQYHINRIASVIEQTFTGLVDMADWANKPADKVQAAFRSRSLAALCIKGIADVNDSVAGDAVVDGYNDGGIDALLFDQVNDAFFFVQSKSVTRKGW